MSEKEEDKLAQELAAAENSTTAPAPENSTTAPAPEDSGNTDVSLDLMHVSLDSVENSANGNMNNEEEKKDSAEIDADLEEEFQMKFEEVMSDLNYFGTPWMKNPQDDLFVNYRKLMSYMEGLKKMDGMMSLAGRGGKSYDRRVLEAMYKYIQDAHLVLLPYIHKWIQMNPTNPARQKVQDLISNYEGMEKVDQYYQRALLEPGARSLSTAFSSSSRQRIKQQENQLQKKDQEILSLKQKQEQDKREKEEKDLQARQDAENKDREIARIQREKEEDTARIQREKEALEKFNEDLKQKLSESCNQLSAAQKEAMTVRHTGEKVKLQLEQEVNKYKDLADKSMFPAAEDLITDDEIGQKMVLVDDGRNGKLINPVVQTQQGGKDQNVAATGTDRVHGLVNYTMKYPPRNENLKNPVSNHQTEKLPPHASHQTRVKHSLNATASAYQHRQPPRTSTHVTYSAEDQIYEQPSCSGQHRMQFDGNRHAHSFDDFLYNDQSSYTHLPPPTAEKTRSKTFSRGKSVPGLEWYVDRNSAKPEEQYTTIASSPGFGSQFAGGHLHARYTAAFEEMGRVQVKKFTGTPHEYPIYRHKLLQKYKELATSDPHLLLRYIETTVGGEAYSYIRRAWYMKDDIHGAVKRIWETLESIYGHPQALIKDATREIKRDPKSVKRELRSLLKFHSDLEMFEGIALSVDQAYVLNRKNMIGKMYESMDDSLRLRFETQYEDPNEWTFQKLVEFLKVQIRQVQDCEYLLRNVEDEDWSMGSRNRTKKDKDRRNYPPGAAAVGINTLEEDIRTSSDKYCLIHPKQKSHNTEDCTSFLQMTEKERYNRVKQVRHCFTCLKDHLRTKCNAKNKCDECGKPHHTLLHLKKKANDGGKATHVRKKEVKANEAESSSNTSSSEIVALGSASDKSELKSKDYAVPIMLLNAVKKDDRGRIVKKVPFYAFLDTGAEKSFCTKELAAKFQKWVPHRKQRIKVLGGEEIERSAMDMPLLLETRSGSVVHAHDIIFMDTTFPYAQNIPNREVVERYLHTKNNFTSVEGPRRIDMIIGAPFLREHGIFTHGKWTRGGRYEPLIGDHYLGKIWWGTQADACFTPSICTAQHLVSRLEDLKEEWKSNEEYATTVSRKEDYMEEELFSRSELETLKKSYYEDQLVVRANSEDTTPSKNDELVLSLYKSSIKEVIDGGSRRLQLPLPWKHPVNNLANNFEAAEKQLYRLQARLKKDPKLQEKYCADFESMLKEKRLEKVPEEQVKLEEEDDSIPVHYLEHFPLGSSRKFRVVYNGKMRYKGVSINDLLHRGPMFLPPLAAILLRFRQGKYAVSGDIKSMFFQIKLDPKDRDFVRVLWFEGPGMSGKLVHLRFSVMPWGLTSIPSIAGFCIWVTAELNYPGVSVWICSTLQSDVYIDDLLKSVDTIEEARELIDGSVAVLKSTGFKMTKWLSNDSRVLQDVEDDDLAPALKDFSDSSDENVIHKALGMTWDATSDTFIMKIKQKNVDRSCLTQRKALSILHSYFDPLGLWCPCLVQLKRFYHSKLARLQLGWDTNLPKEVIEEFFRLMDVADKQLGSIVFPRAYSPLPPKREYQLHLFADANDDTLGAVIYLRIESHGEVATALVFAKSRNLHETKVNRFSTARKELVALAMGSQCYDFCKSSLTLPIKKTCFWSDSTTVIHWCNTKTKELKVFVRRRVDLILRHSGGSLPNYVRSEDNSADIPTRGLDMEEPDQLEKWKFGPSFLKGKETEWPDSGFVLNLPLSDEGKAELIKESVPVCVTEVKVLAEDQSPFMMESFKRCDTLWKALTKVKVMLKCAMVWTSGLHDEDLRYEESSPSIQKCRNVLIRISQLHEMGEIIKLMKNGLTYEGAVKSIPKENRKSWMNSIKQYVPYLDKDQVLRVGGRLQESALDFKQKHPAFLPPKNCVSVLFLRAQHFLSAHLGPYHVLGELARVFGVFPVGGAGSVLEAVKDCFHCKVLRRKVAQQVMSTLPSYRVNAHQPVFCNVGIDYAGPFFVTLGRRTHKRWLCLFVCLATTAVRIQVAYSLSTDGFLNVLRRFLCSTGNVTQMIRSDNGTNFVGAANEMRKALKEFDTSPKRKEYLSRRCIEWEFGPPHSSHHGGIYERQIRTIRKIMLGLPELTTRQPNDDELWTLFLEAEYIMNCRPLTKHAITSTAPIRPLDVMFGVLPPRSQEEVNYISSPGDRLRKGYKFTQQIADGWWKRWIREYLIILQKRSKWTIPEKNLKVGDFVLIEGEATPSRCRYPFGIITDVKIDNDGNVRSATARMSDGRIRNRDIRKFVFLEGDGDDGGKMD